MTETTRASLKSTFSTGATADATDFEDLIDSSPNWTDDVGAFFRIFVSASSTGDARSLLNITSGGTVAAVLNDLVDVSAASPNNNALLQYANSKWIPFDTGDVGRELLAASATSSVQGHLGFGAVGIQVLETETTASINDIIGLSPTTLGTSIIQASATSSLTNLFGWTVGPTIELVLSTAVGTSETTSMGYESPSIVSIHLECVAPALGCSVGQEIHEYEAIGFSVYSSGSTFAIVMGNQPFNILTPLGSVRSVTAQAFSSFKVVAQAIKFS